MKKLLCLMVFAIIIAAMLLPASAAAQTVPSKTTEDMTQIQIVMDGAETSEETIFFAPIPVDEGDQEEIIETFFTQIQQIKESNSVEEYFGEVKDPEGNVVDLKELLDAPELNCFEFCPVKAGGIEQLEDSATLRMQFATVYPAGEKVLVLIGILHEDGIIWTVYEAEVDENNCVVASIDVETLLQVQENRALMAIVSK